MEILELQRLCDQNSKWAKWSIRLAMEYSNNDSLAEHYDYMAELHAAKAAHYARLYLDATFGC